MTGEPITTPAESEAPITNDDVDSLIAISDQAGIPWTDTPGTEFSHPDELALFLLPTRNGTLKLFEGRSRFEDARPGSKTRGQVVVDSRELCIIVPQGYGQAWASFEIDRFDVTPVGLIVALKKGVTGHTPGTVTLLDFTENQRLARSLRDIPAAVVREVIGDVVDAFSTPT